MYLILVWQILWTRVGASIRLIAFVVMIRLLVRMMIWLVIVVVRARLRSMSSVFLFEAMRCCTVFSVDIRRLILRVVAGLLYIRSCVDRVRAWVTVIWDRLFFERPRIG